jgi:hypothetical protein
MNGLVRYFEDILLLQLSLFDGVVKKRDTLLHYLPNSLALPNAIAML